MTKPTLTYFNGRGLGEVTRLILTFVNVEFNDVRVDKIPDELKATLPFGQLPLFEDGIVRLAQSSSIARYVANKHNFAGANAAEKALADSFVDSASDVITPYRNATDDAKKEKFRTETLPKFLAIWEKTLTANGGKHFVGANYTWADVAIYNALYVLSINGYEDVIKSHTTVQGFSAAFEAVPQIAAYLKVRPASQF
ncbi:hypothetical protein SAMD00019534_058280 [Acytostelium subglobosum LB1]|uniref:hypothetical protein n=1 Tax=Acytostelium subglobosum LB1 TaxID=1410327 RepID=UPI000644A0DA|nr:hypothetical protein SAMD00019534_058280 [Acytostelium subglobosum LB1]GAM22653.1 hypothetical protein SAMD00019534_058280 [Acytostelium subglobosum LB1]|eukprot:XP_012754773.1 hypothetical protein SAMD00019534_058280 [Acytostelium subglobosum LB1]